MAIEILCKRYEAWGIDVDVRFQDSRAREYQVTLTFDNDAQIASDLEGRVLAILQAAGVNSASLAHLTGISSSEAAQICNIDSSVFSVEQWMFLAGLAIDDYYTEDEVDMLLSGKSDTTHVHDSRYYTETEVDAFTVKLTGTQTIAGIKTFESIPIFPSSDPTSDNHGVRKAYVDTIIQESRDLLINGNMRWWQRGTSFTAPASEAYTADRWKVLRTNGSGTAPVFNVALDNTDGINYYMKLTVTASGVAGAGMYASVRQYHEYYNSLKGKTVSARINVNVPSGKTGRLYIWDGVGGTGVDITGTGAFREVTISHAVSTSATTLQVMYYIAHGTSFNATAGDIHYIDRIQLTEGATALPFLPYDTILDYEKCRRYCRPMPSWMLFRISQYTANTLIFTIPNSVGMRIYPTLVNAVEGTNISVYNMNNTAQTGFSFVQSYDRIQATKTGHGLTDGFLAIKTTTNPPYLDAEL